MILNKQNTIFINLLLSRENYDKETADSEYLNDF